MVGLGIVLLAVCGGLWFCGALIAGLFKLTFGLLGGLLAGVFGMFAVGLVMLLVLPIVFFALLPLWLPVLFLGGLVWLIVRASHPHTAATQQTQRG